MEGLRELAIVFWVMFGIFILVLLYALPSFMKLLAALLTKKAKWPGDKHYAEPKNVSAEQYTNWYLHGGRPLFAVFVFSFAGVLLAAGVTLLYCVNSFGLIDKFSVSKFNLSVLLFTIFSLIGGFGAVEIFRKIKYIKEFFQSSQYRLERR